MNKIILPLSMETKSNQNPQFRNETPINNTIGFNHKPAMNVFKEALIQFANSNPNLFPNGTNNSYPGLIEQHFSQLCPDFQTPNHPPYAAMIHRAIEELNEKDGSSEDSVSNYIKQEYGDQLPWAHSTLLKHHLEKLCDRNEILMTQNQHYILAVANSDPISNSTSEKKLKSKKISKTVNKLSGSRVKRKKRKSKKDSDAGKMTGGTRKKRKKSKKHKIKQDLESGNTKRKQRKKYEKKENCKQIIKVCQEQEYEQENNLIDVCVYQEKEEGGVCENVIEQNQLEEILMIKRFDVTENENKSSEQPNDDIEQIEKCETKKRKTKQKLKAENSKRNKKNATNEIQVLSEAKLEQNNEPNEQKQIHIQEENKVGEMGMKLHPDVNSILHKNGKRVWTRSQLKMISNKIPKYVSEEIEKQPLKRTPNAVSTQVNGQRAKLRSSQKDACQVASPDLQIESPQILEDPVLENVIEVFDPICTDVDELIQMQAKDEVSGKTKTRNKKEKLKCRMNGKHNMTRRSSGKKSNTSD